MADVETGEMQALAPGQVSADLPPEPEVKGALKPVAEYTPVEMAAGGLGVCAVVSSIGSFVAQAGTTLVLIAGLLSGGLGGYAFYQQTQLTDIRTLKETAEAVKKEVQRLESENRRLKESVDDLGSTAEELKDVERVLDTITQIQGQSVDALKEQLEENKDILSKMQKSMKGRIIQNLITIVYRGDEDGDEMINDEEATEVIDSLSAIGGLKFHEDRLRGAIVGKRVDSIIGVIQHMVTGDLSEEEKIFELDD